MDDIVSGTKFCHYTTLDNARKIINSEYIYWNQLCCMNDIDENELHTDENNQIFIASFCHSEAKSIPLFYLYSGIDGQGCRIEFTDSKLRNVVKSPSIYPVNEKLCKLKKKYDKCEYEIYAGWVHYIAESGYHFYRGREEKRYVDFKTAIEELKRLPEFYFIKNPIWKYECEFRIVIKFNKPISYKRIALHLPIKQNETGISITCGPEMQEDMLNTLHDEFAEYGIHKLKMFSDDKKRIRMGLIDRNAAFYRKRG